MKLYFKILDYIENTILALSMFTMMAITFLNIVVRHFTNASFAFTEELVGPLFILVTLVGAGAVARRGGHIGLTLITDKLSENKRKYVFTFTALLSIFFSVLIVYQGYNITTTQIARGVTTPALRWPQWVFTSFVPIGGFFMVLEFFNYALLLLTGKIHDEPKENIEEMV